MESGIGEIQHLYRCIPYDSIAVAARVGAAGVRYGIYQIPGCVVSLAGKVCAGCCVEYIPVKRS